MWVVMLFFFFFNDTATTEIYTYGLTLSLHDALPIWLQQWALVIGVIAGALVIPPVLDLLNQAYGFLGAPGVDPARALPAPQAGLISALAQGVITGNIEDRKSTRLNSSH